VKRLTLAFATFLVLPLRIGACGFGAYDSYPLNLTYKMIGLPIIWRLRTVAFAALALAVFGAIECPSPNKKRDKKRHL